MVEWALKCPWPHSHSPEFHFHLFRYLKWPRELGLAVTLDQCKCTVENAKLSTELEKGRAGALAGEVRSSLGMLSPYPCKE
jgi:hypothetical protein